MHCIQTAMSRVLNIRFELVELVLGRVSMPHKRIVTLADQYIDLLEGNPKPLPRNITRDCLGNLNEFWIGNDTLCALHVLVDRNDRLGGTIRSHDQRADTTTCLDTDDDRNGHISSTSGLQARDSASKLDRTMIAVP